MAFILHIQVQCLCVCDYYQTVLNSAFCIIFANSFSIEQTVNGITRIVITHIVYCWIFS